MHRSREQKRNHGNHQNSKKYKLISYDMTKDLVARINDSLLMYSKWR